MLSLTRSARQRRGSRPTVQVHTSGTSRAGSTDGAATATRAPSRIDLFTEYLRDELTDLGSLLALRLTLDQVLDQYQPFGARPSLLLIDIDGFEKVNSTYGRDIADRVLVITAARLRGIIPDASYRTGGDEYVALLDPAPMITAVARAEEIQETLSEPIDFGGSTISISVSVALVMLGYRHRVDALLRDADVTMYRAKSEGGNRLDLYNWEVDSWALARKRDVRRLEQEVEELRIQNRILTEAMTLDLVTGLPNELAFEADHVQFEAWRKRTSEPYSVLRVCVDGIDDTAHHFRSPEGVAALTAISHAVRDTVRRSDRAYVLERGEYAVLLRGATIEQAVAAAERVRMAVDRLEAEHPGDPERHLTVSIAAIEAGFRHASGSDVLDEVNHLLRNAVGSGGGRTVWPL